MRNKRKKDQDVLVTPLFASWSALEMASATRIPCVDEGGGGEKTERKYEGGKENAVFLFRLGESWQAEKMGNSQIPGKDWVPQY